jgi:hypothetical protein
VDYRPPAAAAPVPTPAPTSPGEGKDTSRVSAAASKPATTKPAAEPETKAPGREVTVQLATRVKPSVATLVDNGYARTGRSKRELIEEAIENAPWLAEL